MVTSLCLILPKVSGRCSSSSLTQITNVHWVHPHLSFPFSLPLLGIGFPDSSVGKESACNAGDPGLIPGSRRYATEGIDTPLQHSWASLVAILSTENRELSIQVLCSFQIELFVFLLSLCKIFRTLDPFQIQDLQISSPFCRQPFHFLDNAF